MRVSRTMTTLKWIARVGSLLSIGLILLFFIGEGFHPTRVAARDWVGLVFFPAGVVVGLLIAWWKEGVGAGITLASLLAFYGVYGVLMGSHIHGWAFITFTSPGLLFLLFWFLSRIKFSEAIAKL
jgi:hypothetical protein